MVILWNFKRWSGIVMRAVKALLAFSCGLLPTAIYADMIETEGLPPYEICALCHSLDGVSQMSKFPKLAGQPSLYLQKQIKDFRDEHRSNDGGQMSAIVTELAVEEISVAAGWFSAQPHPVPEEPGADHEIGRALFENQGCGECHAGVKQQSPFHPYLRSQHAAYLVKQMMDFKSGDRQNDPDQKMQKKMSVLSDDEITAIASYLAATPRKAEMSQ